MIKKKYLGDGVYAASDGLRLILTAQRGDSLHTVYLGSSELMDLVAYAEQVWDRKFQRSDWEDIRHDLLA